MKNTDRLVLRHDIDIPANRLWYTLYTPSTAHRRRHTTQTPVKTAFGKPPLFLKACCLVPLLHLDFSIAFSTPFRIATRIDRPTTRQTKDQTSRKQRKNRFLNLFAMRNHFLLGQYQNTSYTKCFHDANGAKLTLDAAQAYQLTTSAKNGPLVFGL